MNEINLETIKETQYEILKIVSSLTDLKNLLEKDFISDEAKKQLNKQFWEMVEKLKKDKKVEEWRNKAHELATKYKACLTCFNKGDDWNLWPETYECKKCHELRGMGKLNKISKE